jgi:membrane peptidoglycan carboxypeptidase
LTIAEAATIAALIRRPHYYSPVNHPDRAVDRRNTNCGA